MISNLLWCGGIIGAVFLLWFAILLMKAYGVLGTPEEKAEKKLELKEYKYRKMASDRKIWEKARTVVADLGDGRYYRDEKITIHYGYISDDPDADDPYWMDLSTPGIGRFFFVTILDRERQVFECIRRYQTPDVQRFNPGAWEDHLNMLYKVKAPAAKKEADKKKREERSNRFG